MASNVAGHACFIEESDRNLKKVRNITVLSIKERNSVTFLTDSWLLLGGSGRKW